MTKRSIIIDEYGHIERFEPSTHLMKLLGHRNIKNILFSTQLIKPRNDEEYVSKAAKTIDEARTLVEAGFEYICDVEGVKLFRKRK